MTSEKLAATLAELQRGQRPPCPWCSNEQCDPDTDHRGACWGCGSEADVYGYDRSKKCYEAQIAKMQAQYSKLDELYQSQMDNYRDTIVERDELTAEVARLRDAMVCACEFMSPQFAAHEVLTTALRGKEDK